jgi:hypothetical protein
MWLESLKEIGKVDKAISLVYTPKDRKRNPKWDKLVELYPEAEFFFLTDEDSINKLIPLYMPIIRPYMLMKYFKLHPELKEKAVFYCDADVLFTKIFNIDKFLEDDVCYVSDTNSYISSTYFDSKIKDVKPDKLEEYKTRDILQEVTSKVGISREIAEKYKLNSGGAQYLLKNIDWQFWDKCITDCLHIRSYLRAINTEFFENENKGFQSWCADMWAVLWNIWGRGMDSKIVPEMDFSWSSDPIPKIDKCPIFHNAGIVSELQGDIPVFYKGKYHSGKNPFEDPNLELLYNNEKTKYLCNWHYISKMIDLKSKYDMSYLN